MSGQRPSLRRPALWPYVLAAALIVSAIAATVIWLGPLPPRVVVMSTGAPGSDYALLAVRYQAILKSSGLAVIPDDGMKDAAEKVIASLGKAA